MRMGPRRRWPIRSGKPSPVMSPTAVIKWIEPQREPAWIEPQREPANTGAANRRRPLPARKYIAPVDAERVITSPFPSPFQSPTLSTRLVSLNTEPVSMMWPMFLPPVLANATSLPLDLRPIRSDLLLPTSWPDEARKSTRLKALNGPYRRPTAPLLSPG